MDAHCHRESGPCVAERHQAARIGDKCFVLIAYKSARERYIPYHDMLGSHTCTVVCAHAIITCIDVAHVLHTVFNMQCSSL